MADELKPDLGEKLHKIVRTSPQTAAALSKMNQSSLDTRTLEKPKNLTELAISTNEKIKNNESIIQLFPDVELCIQILTSSIVSPNNIIAPSNLTYSVEEIKLPSSIMASVMSVIKDYMEKVYDLSATLPIILRESMFTKGAYIEAIISEAALDAIINPVRTSGEISMESFYKDFDKLTSKHKYLGPDVKNANLTLSTEELTYMCYLPKKQKVKNDISISLEDLKISFTDNIGVLATHKLAIDAMSRSISNESFSDELIGVENDIGYLFKINDSMSKKDVVTVTKYDDTHRNSVGRPLRFKLPVESTIPIHVVNDVTKHIGYLVLLDDRGVPVSVDGDITDDQLMAMIKSNSDTSLANSIVKKTKDSLYGMTKKDVKLDNVERIYGALVEKAIKDKFKTGMFGEIADIKESIDIYRVMLFRSLKAQKTRLLFIPAENVAFYAFDYRENGTGKSLLEKTAVLFSLRSILLFTKVSASVRNSITTTNYTVTLEENDPDPDSTKEIVMSEILKQSIPYAPIGLNRLDDITDWLNKISRTFTFKNPSMPDMTIEKNEEASSKIIPESTIDEDVSNNIIMSFGLTPEMVQTGFSADYATTVVAKNLLLAKRVAQLQAIFNAQITQNVRKLMINDADIRARLQAIFESNIAEIKKYIKKDKDAKKTDPSIEDPLAKVKDRDLAAVLVKHFCYNVYASLPTPELTEAQTAYNAFTAYNTAVSEAIDAVITDETLPDNYVGEPGKFLKEVKYVIKAAMLRKWMSENDYLPELSEFLTFGDDGKPIFKALEEFNGMLGNISEVIIPFLKENKKLLDKVNDKVTAITGDSGDSGDGYGDENTDNSGGDEGFGEGGDEFSENNDGTEEGLGDGTDTGLTEDGVDNDNPENGEEETDPLKDKDSEEDARADDKKSDTNSEEIDDTEADDKKAKDKEDEEAAKAKEEDEAKKKEEAEKAKEK